MTFHVAFSEILHEHTWQRYNIALDEEACAEACACLEAEATGPWSFRVMNSPRGDLLPSDMVYAFFFKEPSDIVILRKFDTYRLWP
jgi:hypothetical protein